MKSMIKELWHGNMIPQEDIRTNSKEMKELLGYMSRHHEDLEKSFSDEQKEIFEKFHNCWDEYVSLVVAGERDQDIAEELGVSINTVRTHLRVMMDKTGIRSRTALAVRVRDAGFVIVEPKEDEI